MIGPGRGTSSWTSPSQKFLDRADLCGKLGLGLLHSIEAFQVFIASVMMYVAQLDPLPPDFPSLEGRACRSWLPGPKDWISTGFLKGMTTAFFPKELPDLQLSSVAARARVATHEDALHGGLRVRHRARDLRRVMHAADNSFHVGRFAQWLKGNFLFSLEAATDTLQKREQHLRHDTSMMYSEGLPNQERQGWQARATKVLVSGNEVEARVHIRKRLDRWQIATLPSHRVERWLNILPQHQ